MKTRDLESSFEEYRRDRTYRRLQNSKPTRPMGKNQAVLKQIEAAELGEVRDERLTREVHDFFADATRTAAGIVNRIADDKEEEEAQKMRSEIHEFLHDVIRRAECFMTALKDRPNLGVEQNLEPQMHNLVGPQLDEFRNEGTARLDDKHIGQDPFHVDEVASDLFDGDDVVEDTEEARLRQAIETLVASGVLDESQADAAFAEMQRRGG